MPRITAEIAGVRLDSTKITDAVSDAIHSTVDAASDMLKPAQPFTIDEAADLSVKPFDSKEVKFLKAQASHWKNEATLWRTSAVEFQTLLNAERERCPF